MATVLVSYHLFESINNDVSLFYATKKLREISFG